MTSDHERREVERMRDRSEFQRLLDQHAGTRALALEAIASRLMERRGRVDRSTNGERLLDR